MFGNDSILKYNYSFYAVNGAQLNEGDSEAHEAGKLKHAIFPDNNLGKTFGSRIGIFPFSDSNLEIGFSGMYGKVGSSHSDYEDIAALHHAFDLSFVKTLPAINSVLDVKGQ